MYGPTQNVQVMLVSGLIGSKFKCPYFLDFDYNVTPEHYHYTVKDLYDIECKVIISSCDQHPKNAGLRQKLGVSEDNVEMKRFSRRQSEDSSAASNLSSQPMVSETPEDPLAISIARDETEL